MDEATTPEWPSAPAPKPKRKFPWKGFTIGALAFIVGLGLGAASVTSDDEKNGEPVAASDDNATPETVTVTSIVTKTETKEVEVETVPDACLDALDSAEEVIRISGEAAQVAGEGLQIAGDAFGAIGDGDAEELYRQQGLMETIGPRVNDLADEVSPHVQDFNDQKEECRSAAQ